MSKPFIEFVHPDDRERTSSEQKPGTARRRVCARIATFAKMVGTKWLLWNAAPGAGRQLIYSVARDITERKRVEAERDSLVRQLQAALAEVGTLQGFLPICSYCKSIRDDENYWESVETYISKHTNTVFSHSICPACYRNVVEPGFKTREHE